MSVAAYAQPEGSPAVSPDNERDKSRALECLHCATKLAEDSTAPFCCSGCAFVYALIHREDLGRYYELRGKRGIPLFGLGARAHDTKWVTPIEEQLEKADSVTRIDLDVQGLHCTGCVWLIDAVFQKQEGAVQAVINPALGKAQLGVRAGFSLRSFVEQIERFGYRFGPPVKNEAQRSSDLLVRMGITIAIAMNSMIFAISSYAGLTEGALAHLFYSLNFGLSLVSIAVGGTVFFRSAFHGLRRGLLHLDLPIALGILAAFSGSAWSFFTRGSTSAYFDTINIFIALMLVGRFLQERVLERNRRYLLANDGVESLLTRRIDGESSNVTVVPCTSIEKGDTLLIVPGDLVPVTSTLETAASFSLDWINGESRPRDFAAGAALPAGAFLSGTRAVTVRAQEDFSASMLVELLRSPLARDIDGPRTGAFWQRLTKFYVVAVLMAGALGFSFAWLRSHDIAHSLDVLTAVLVITCPCAFGIATPLAYELVQNGLRKAGLFVRSPGFLDRATSVRKVVFDKTGTLTTGTLKIADTDALKTLDQEAKRVLYNLASRSHHPKSQAVARELATDTSLSFEPSWEVCEEAGRGLSLSYEGREFRLGAPDWVSQDEGNGLGDIAFGESGHILARLFTVEELREDARHEIARLRAHGYEVWILSGDGEARVRAMAERCGVDPSHAIGGRSPHDKAAFLRDIDRGDTMMIGDGINDSLVVERAHTSGTPAIDRPFMAARSDFYFVTAGLRPIRLALEASRKLRGVVRRNLALAVTYNVGAVGLAWAGVMSPLLAAVLMPISSIVTLLATMVSLTGRSAPWKS